MLLTDELKSSFIIHLATNCSHVIHSGGWKLLCFVGWIYTTVIISRDGDGDDPLIIKLDISSF